jgi:hypothetical protein
MAPQAEEPLPALPPIKTAPLPPRRLMTLPPAPASSSSSAGDSGKEAEEPSTSTLEESRLRPPAVCPVVPRKPPPPRLPAPKRKPPALPPSPARVFVTVPRDLSTNFQSLSPKKRIRVS